MKVFLMKDFYFEKWEKGVCYSSSALAALETDMVFESMRVSYKIFHF